MSCVMCRVVGAVHLISTHLVSSHALFSSYAYMLMMLSAPLTLQRDLSARCVKRPSAML